ncbi:hypothetical protein K2Z83_10600 [Oscillochloris sp. ZM17-4]|uniref:hypothetical protein n=1 Tax=Oscillochloris sp. ZM17-4 TaxID=2866714 RepID=UPI001C73621F|nr:hypothetical protein [Oscillochloris sp. ZM17-4]MBX0328127.1 hypothetical protein [Oscillochloris sp. ZM17-4]
MPATINLQIALATLGPLLRRQPAMVIADNLESILPAGAAPLDAGGRAELWTTLPSPCPSGDLGATERLGDCGCGAWRWGGLWPSPPSPQPPTPNPQPNRLA